MTRRFRTLLFCACATLPALPIEAQAQDKAQDRASVTQDIIVTARRTEERLQDVPISITVFNQEELANRNVVNAQDLAAYTPSLSANGNFGSENSSFAIRGFAQDIGTAPSVGVYFADVVAPRGASNGLPSGDGAGPGAFFDLQNVQILKGPQGTLFGRNTTGGAILLVPLDLLNLNARWTNIAGAPIDLSLFMTNVTREKYYSFIAGLGSPSVNFETATLGEPQMYGARLRFRFGG